MATQHNWPAIRHDYRPFGLSYHKLAAPTIADLVKVCEHYLEVINTQCDGERKTRTYIDVKTTIQMVYRMVLKLARTTEQVHRQKVRNSHMEHEFDVLSSADLPTDPKRTVEGMKHELLTLETEYVLRLDTIESLKRRILMLEASLEPTTDPCLF
ncbi:hypothetical protein GMRT_11123 [Giardia muris]|uniref:Uncharacterized protein n=1 Tax=Giardia muris TaxID=5742 RepID=A0A4Z1SST9_GIAMU|nr:hypothetical protein GMRT_11123 [Giardia muris]|eukprot:TNJ28934.1 hypothetical protein GMRT_11123 [Giardia muris]